MHAKGFHEKESLIGTESDLEGIQTVLRAFYEGLSEHDLNALNGTTSPGFYLLEHGEYWDLEFLKQKIGEIKPDGYSRRNRFAFKRIEIFGTDAFAVWDLFADVVRDESQSELYWLESGTFKKIAGKWKVHFLHSTRAPHD